MKSIYLEILGTFIFSAPQKDTLCAAIKKVLFLSCFYYSIGDLHPPKFIGTSGDYEQLKEFRLI